MQPTAKRQAIYRAKSGGSEPKTTSNDIQHLTHLYVGQSARDPYCQWANPSQRTTWSCTGGRELGVQLHILSLVTSALDRGDWSASRLGHFTPRKRTPVPTTYETWWAPEPVWTFWRRYSFQPLSGFETRTAQQWPRECNDYATSAQIRRVSRHIPVIRGLWKQPA
jgi:hypothetical protein